MDWSSVSVWYVVNRGKLIKVDGVEAPAGHIIDIQTTYKYLGIPQTHGNNKEKARKTATSKYPKG